MEMDGRSIGWKRRQEEEESIGLRGACLPELCLPLQACNAAGKLGFKHSQPSGSECRAHPHGRRNSKVCTG